MQKLSDSFQISRLYHPSQTDAENLSRISKASKAYWGYPVEWLELWRADLEVTPDYLARHHSFVLQNKADSTYLGFCILSEEGDHTLWIEHLWILPDYIGQGLGSVLLNTALNACIQTGHRSAKVIADPNAAAFYGAQGFHTFDYHASQPGDRKLPVMEKLLG